MGEGRKGDKGKGPKKGGQSERHVMSHGAMTALGNVRWYFHLKQRIEGASTSKGCKRKQ